MLGVIDFGAEIAYTNKVIEHAECFRVMGKVIKYRTGRRQYVQL